MSASRLSLAEARRLGQGSGHLAADPTYARLIVRRISPVVSWAVARWTPLSADVITASSIAAGTAGGLLIAAGTPLAALAAAFLLQLAYLLDVADGEVARIRGTAGLRGTYLDLVGHFLQNRALYAGAGWSLIAVSGGAPWAIVIALVALGFAVPFGYYARLHVLGSAAGMSHPEHGGASAPARPARMGARSLVTWAYRRLAFLWAYPASMNLFCLALLIDAGRGAAGDPQALAVPVLIAGFGPTLALKQIGHAIRLLRSEAWSSS